MMFLKQNNDEIISKKIIIVFLDWESNKEYHKKSNRWIYSDKRKNENTFKVIFNLINTSIRFSEFRISNF